MNYLEQAREVIRLEAEEIAGLATKLTSDFEGAIKAILGSEGRVVVCGMGKSGIVGRKISATLASTGTPSYFMHPGEAYHGDLGMVVPDDVFIAISNSGETDEVVKLLPFLKDNGNTIVAMTGKSSSTLAKAGHFHLDIGVNVEACPLQLAPTSSTSATMVMGDALAVTLMKARNFKPEGFARFHPGGSLGRRLLGRVDDEMQSGDLPWATEDLSLLDLIAVMSKGRLGVALFNFAQGGLGIVTDGDLRRAMELDGETMFRKRAGDYIKKNPLTVLSGTRIEDAIALMQSRGITLLPVVDQSGRCLGVFQK